MDAKRLSALIDGIYAAAVTPERWPDVAAQVARFFDADSTAIQVRGGDFNNIALRVLTANYDEQAQKDYVAYFHKLDPWANNWHAIDRPGIFAGSELIDPDTLRNSELYIDFARRLGCFHFLGAGLNLDPATKLLIGIHRPIERQDFDVEHRHRLELVLPHLSRAVHMHGLLAKANAQRRLAGEVLGALSVAAILVDAGCKVIFANDVAASLLAAGDGLLVRQAHLTARDSQQDSALRQAIRDASLLASGHVAQLPQKALLVRRARRRPLSVLVMPFQKDAWSDEPCGVSAVVFVHDPEARRPPATAALAALYKLTLAEARLLDAVLQGDRIADYADRAGISINTANTQLKQIFAKTETNRQAELVRQVLSDPIASLVRGER